MTRKPTPPPDREPARGGDTVDGGTVEIDVARTGGFAGLTRRWSAQPAPDELPDWIVLIDSCPWDDARADAGADDGTDGAATPAPVPDGFVWWIRASWSDAHTREAELSDAAVTGAWRDLVDAVRAWHPPAAPAERAGTGEGR